MKIKDCMSRDVCTVAPDRSIREAARLMAEHDVGAIPVADQDRLVGMITDRDIAVRAVCAGKSPDTPVRETMSAEVKYCYEDEDCDHVARNMADQQLRRLPVMDRDKRLVGIIAIGDLAQGDDARGIGKALGGISRPGGRHSQAPDGHTQRSTA